MKKVLIGLATVGMLLNGCAGATTNPFTKKVCEDKTKILQLSYSNVQSATSAYGKGIAQYEYFEALDNFIDDCKVVELPRVQKAVNKAIILYNKMYNDGYRSIK